MAIHLNSNRRIGRVIFFVEGLVDEPGLLRHLFCNALGYTTVAYDNKGKSYQEYRREGDQHSKVFVVPMPTPFIKNILGNEEFLDDIYHTFSRYGLNRDEAFHYYLFDRDRKSNKKDAVLSKIALLKNPLDNGIELPGALLLSYPCVQAYYCEASGDNASFLNSKEAKKHVNANSLKSLDESSVVVAATNMLATLLNLRGKPFDTEELSDYSKINGKSMKKRKGIGRKTAMHIGP